MGDSLAMMQTDERMWPRWIALVAAGFSLFVAVVSPFIHAAETATTAILVLTWIATVPWLIEATGRILPRPLFAAAVFVPLAILNVGGGAFGLAMEHDGQLSLMLLTLAVGQLAASVPVRRALVYALLATLLPLGRYLVEPHFVEWVFWAAGIFLATCGGLLLQRQHALVVQLHAAQAALAEEAATQERRRIAREVHDVIAHSLTVSMLHVTAARLAVRRDVAAAEEALFDAERLGRQALTDVRRTVGLLHDGEGGATATALPDASDLPALVEAYVLAGQQVQLRCTADLASATPAGGLALYRAVQEGLANAAKHAPGEPVTVAVSRQGDRLVAEVVNTLNGTSSSNGQGGIGLRGMRERVEAVGGTVEAGRRDDTWVTSCAIPVQPAP